MFFCPEEKCNSVFILKRLLMFFCPEEKCNSVFILKRLYVLIPPYFL